MAASVPEIMDVSLYLLARAFKGFSVCERQRFRKQVLFIEFLKLYA
jgi:hypothetical protein